MARTTPPPLSYDDDYFADTRMSFGEHLEVLRQHLLRAIYGLLIGIFLAFFIAKDAMAIITRPVEEAVKAYELERPQQTIKTVSADPEHPLHQPRRVDVLLSPAELATALKELDPEFFKGLKTPPAEAPPLRRTVTLADPVQVASELHAVTSQIGARSGLSALNPMEAFLVYLKVALMLGFVMSSPWVIYQIWAFVAAGLYPHEKRYVHIYFPASVGLFFAGVVVCQVAVIPLALSTLLSYNRWLNIDPNFRLTEWLSFAIWTPVLTGIFFETPLVMLFLSKLGFTSRMFLSGWRVAVFVMLVIAVLFSPAVDPVTLGAIWTPMVALYFLGILLVWRSEQRSSGLAAEEETVWNG